MWPPLPQKLDAVSVLLRFISEITFVCLLYLWAFRLLEIFIGYLATAVYGSAASQGTVEGTKLNARPVCSHVLKHVCSDITVTLR